MPDSRDVQREAVRRLGLSPEVQDALLAVQAEIDASYKDKLVETMQAVNRLTAAVDRMQRTLEVLIENVHPELKSKVPPALRIAGPGEEADLASVAVVADPLALGYTLSQADLARLLNVTPADMSVLVRAFKLDADPDYAVVVRSAGRRIVNFQAAAAERFLTLLDDPPTDLTANEKAAVRRALQPARPGTR